MIGLRVKFAGKEKDIHMMDDQRLIVFDSYHNRDCQINAMDIKPGNDHLVLNENEYHAVLRKVYEETGENS